MNMNEAYETRHIATSVPLPLHRELKLLASERNLSLSRFFRETLIDRLEKERKKSRRRRASK